MPTHFKRAVGAESLFSSVLSFSARWEPEGANQTFAKGTPVVWSSGLLVASTSPIETDTANKVTGLAVEAGHNKAAAVTNLCKFIPAIDGIIFYANLLTGDGADYTFAAADVVDAGAALRSKSGLITTGVVDWFLDAADTNGATVVSTKSDIVISNEPIGDRAQVGDINARVGFVFVLGVRTFPDS